MIAPCEENRDEGRNDNPPLVLAFEEEQSEDKKEYGDGTEIHRTRRERLRSPIHRQLLYRLLHIRLSGTPEKFLRGSVLQMRIAG